MQGIRRNRGLTHRLVGLVAAYALVIQAILAGALGAGFAAIDPTHESAFPLVLCTAGQDSGPQTPAPASDHRAYKHPCTLCAAVAHAPVLPAESVPVFAHRTEGLAVIWTHAQEALPDDAQLFRKQARGPPHLT